MCAGAHENNHIMPVRLLSSTPKGQQEISADAELAMTCPIAPQGMIARFMSCRPQRDNRSQSLRNELVQSADLGRLLAAALLGCICFRQLPPARACLNRDRRNSITTA